MSNTYHQLYVHAVFAVKYREATIKKEWKPQLLAVIGNLINETGCHTYLVNGVEDHVHCLFGLKPSVALSDVMKSVKAKSSKWVNESGKLQNRFEWQVGYGAFSYSHSHLDRVYRYIQNQEIHHQKETFREEYIRMLESFGVDYEAQYLFQDLIAHEV
ncbi:MAG: IS200/IS605 family transposase [Bacteroidetes bacterium]|nr:IS200/IS605 family transposase [Bacteroidota bacterium]